MNLFLILTIFFLTSCSAIKYPHNYFSDCEKKFNKFSALSECAMKEIKEDCQGNSVCKPEETRFVNIIKRLQVMVNNEEISENEAMFRYFNLIDYEESKFKLSGNMYLPNFYKNSTNFYIRGTPSCYFSRNEFCY
tara:strand:+ start:81 stop:485 length:405 start_codon:yes stop_codon:yes gene_type:complete